MNNRKLISILAVISAPMLVVAQDAAYAADGNHAPVNYGEAPAGHTPPPPPPPPPPSSTPCEETPTPTPEPAHETPCDEPTHTPSPHPDPAPNYGQPAEVITTTTPCTTETPKPVETCTSGGGNGSTPGTEIYAVLFDKAQFGGERHPIDGKVGDCRGLSGVSVGSLKTVSAVGGDPFTQESNIQATFEFFDGTNCAGNSMGQVTGSQADLTSTLSASKSGESVGPLSVRFVSGAPENANGTSTDSESDDSAGALANSAQSLTAPASIFAMAVASVFAYLF